MNDSWIEMRGQNCETLAAVDRCSPRCLSAILFPLVPREAREFNTYVFSVLSSHRPFQPMKKCQNWLIPRGHFQVKKTNCKACVFTRRRFFLLQLKAIFLPGSTKSIPNVGKWCFSQFEFRFTRFVSPFRVSEQGSVTFDHALILLRFNSKTSGCFDVHLP